MQQIMEEQFCNILCCQNLVLLQIKFILLGITKVFGLCPLSAVLKNTVFQKLDLFLSLSEWVGGT
jgi:hypothetical protein